MNVDAEFLLNFRRTEQRIIRGTIQPNEIWNYRGMPITLKLDASSSSRISGSSPIGFQIIVPRARTTLEREVFCF